MSKKIKVIFIISILIVLIIGGGLLGYRKLNKGDWKLISPLGKVEEKKELPLKKYELDRLKNRKAKPSQIVLERVLSEGENFTASNAAFASYLFSYISEGKRISGMANIPREMNFANTEDGFPVIVMLRGYVDLEMYETGVGTQRAGEVLAQNGYITLAPDYLGYGDSDNPPDNVWEERFLKNINIQDLLASIGSLAQADSNKVGIWGHSNGGMSALTALELSGKGYPTCLWAPVSKFFPYDILYYIDEFEDRGKALRKSLAEFEKDYDPEKYSFDNYLEWIEAPIQLHQGLGDPYIPVSWPDNLTARLEELEKDITYYTYPGAGHHMEGVWDMVVERDIKFFDEKLNF